jgi:hypothetical protein
MQPSYATLDTTYAVVLERGMYSGLRKKKGYHTILNSYVACTRHEVSFR